MASWQQTITTLKTQLATLEKQVAALQTMITTQAATIAARDAEIVTLKARIAVLEGGTTVPPPPPTPTPTGWPDATNTGVPAGTTLTSYTGPSTITTANTIIDGKLITTGLSIKAANVVIKNSKLQAAVYFGIQSEQYPVTIERCDIDGKGGLAGSYGLYGMGTFTANDIYGWENGIAPIGSGAVIRGNYIHALQAPGSPHYDGIALHGGQSNVLIENNTIVGRDNACVFITDDFASISNITVSHNQMLCQAGNLPVFTFFVDGRKAGGTVTGIVCKDNIIQRGYYGYTSVDQAGVTFSNNVTPEGTPVPGAVTAGTGSTV